MGTDLDRMASQDQGGRKTPKHEGGCNREGVDVTATMHAEHGKHKGKPKK